MFRFEHPEYLNLFILLPVLLAGYLLYLRWKKQSAVRYGDPAVIRRLMPDVSGIRSHIRFSLLLLTIASVILTLANPQIGSRIEKVQRRGVDLVIALDVSNSMLAQDIQPNRIERAKQSISRLIDELENDRIGLIVFAGKAYNQLPITTDYGAAKLMLSTVKPDLVPVQGTAIGQAIEMAMASFKSEESGKAIIIITDGENHEDDAVGRAKEAAAAGIQVYTIGMGLADGAPIPVYRENQQVGFKKDRSGSTVITRLDEAMLQQIAEAGNGIYVRANNTQAGLRKVFEEISRLEQNTYDTMSYSEYDDRFQYFAGLAIFLMVLNFMLNERKSRWAGKFQLFKPEQTLRR